MEVTEITESAQSGVCFFLMQKKRYGLFRVSMANLVHNGLED